MAAAAWIALGVTGCSSDASDGPKPGSLAPGGAEITINDNGLGKFRGAACTQADDLTTLTTGDEESGSTVVVSNADGLTAKAVDIRNLGGFTGSYHEHLEGTAEVTLDDATYLITGTAEGFDTDKPSFRSTATFSIKVAC